MGKKQEIERIAGIPVAEIEQLDKAAALAGAAKELGGGMFSESLRMAEAMAGLQRALTEEVMKSILYLKGKAVGFRTDEKERGKDYPLTTVRDCLIEAVMRGARPVGNEFNIIADGPYFTRQFFERKVKELPGLTDLDPREILKAKDVAPGIIDVDFTVTWKMNGEPMELSGTIPVRVNRGMGADAVLGKARRKALARVYQRATGSEQLLPEGDVDDVDLPPAAKKSGLQAGRSKVGADADAEVIPPIPGGSISTKEPEAPQDPPEQENVQPEPAQEEPAPSQSNSGFVMTTGFQYELQQAAMCNDWTMDDLKEYVRETFGCEIPRISDRQDYETALQWVKKRKPTRK